MMGNKMLIAVDVDGTLYDGANVAREAVTALSDACAAGHSLVIVTGRRWEGLDLVVPEVLVLADRVVCEEGGVMVDWRRGRVELLADPVELDLVAGLVAAGITPLDVGQVVVGAPATFLREVTEVRQRLGSSRRVVHNKASIALVPPECDKGTGLRTAAAELGLSGAPILALGDAANDLPMFAAATIAVGMANADGAVRAAGVQLTAASVGLGVVEALHRFLPPAPGG